MNIHEQSNALRTIYLDIRKRLYEPMFRKKIIIVMNKNTDKEWYESILKKIEGVTLMIENCLLMCEPRRALRYLAALNILTQSLQERTEKDFLYLMNKMRLPYNDLIAKT
jgi:hypothetical protein